MDFIFLKYRSQFSYASLPLKIRTMLRYPLIRAILLFSILLSVTQCRAVVTPELSLSTTQIFPAAGQVIDVIATGGDATSGVSLGLEIGNGDSILDEPIFVSLDFSPGPFDDVGHVQSNDGPVASAENLIEAFITTLSPDDEFTHDGVIARLTIDASGFSPGEEFPFLWNWSTNLPGAASSSFVIDDQEVVAMSGNLVLSIIPEPTSLSLVILALSALLASKQRMKRLECQHNYPAHLS